MKIGHLGFRASDFAYKIGIHGITASDLASRIGRPAFTASDLACRNGRLAFTASVLLCGNVRLASKMSILYLLEDSTPSTSRSQVDGQLFRSRYLAGHVLVIRCLTVSVDTISKAVHGHASREEIREVDGQGAR